MVIKEMAGPKVVVTMEEITKMEVDCGMCHFDECDRRKERKMNYSLE